MIPKVIIQTGPPDLSLSLKAAVVNVKLLHPEFEYIFFDDAKVEEFVQEQCTEWRDAYGSFKFKIQRYDFFRYLAVYRYGGFYLDLDVFLAEQLTPLVSSECVFSFEELTDSTFFWDRFRMDWQIGNYAFGAEPGHPFLEAIIANCLRAKQDPAWVRPMMNWIPKPFYDEFYILNTTGPGLVSRTYAENPTLAQRVKVVFPDDVRDPRSWHQFGKFGFHDMAGSWRDRESFLSVRLRRLWEGWKYRRTLANSKGRGKTR
ncbi:MAG: hypothetical protein LAO18_22760 [Acidobacteriia bacterium]|nr:hypothetical protein [Terriglobia bacterium]